MTREELVSLLRTQPFRPFKIHLTNGEVYEIRHPDMALPTFGTVHIAIPPASNPDGFDRVVIASLLHVLKVEPSPVAPPPVGANGSAA